MKAFQSQVFEQFLRGISLKECYAAVGSIGNTWLDVLGTYAVTHLLLLTLPLSYPYSLSVPFTVCSFYPLFLSSFLSSFLPPSSLFSSTPSFPSPHPLLPFLHHFYFQSVPPSSHPLNPYFLPFLPPLICPSIPLIPTPSILPSLSHYLLSFLNTFTSYRHIHSIFIFTTETQGMEMDDDELLALISERKTISKTIDQYEGKTQSVKTNP